MPAKSILDIVVNSGAFDSYVKQFNKYQDELKKQPATWGSIGKAATAAGAPFIRLAAQVSLFNQRLAQAPTNMARFRVIAQGSVAVVDRLAVGTWKISRNVANTAVSLIKWLGVLSAVSGLVGGGGLFGLARLAGSAFEQRRSAKGLGVSTGEQKAFDLNFGKFVDSQALLSNVAEAMQDQSKRWTLYAAGLTDAQMQGKNPAEVADMLLPLLRKRFNESGRTQQGAEAFGLTQFGSLQDLNRLANTSNEEFNASRASYARDRSQLGLSDQTARAWADFYAQLQRAGASIENTFIKGLTPLIPALTKLSESVSKALAGFLSNPKMGEWISNFGSALEKSANYLGSDEFQRSVKRFVEGISVIGEKLYWLLTKLGWVSGDSAPTPPATAPPAIAAGNPANMTVWQAIKADLARMTGRSSAGAASTDVSDRINAGLAEGAGIKAMDKPEAYAHFARLEARDNLPPGLLRGVYKQESNEGQNVIGPMTKYGRALGPFQFIPRTAQEYGLDDPMDTAKSADAASRKFKNLLRYYKGDVPKALAAYNTGEGNLDRAIKKANDASKPADWLSYTSPETQGYVGNITKSMAAQPGQAVKIDIFNNTGGSAVVTANQMAH